MNKKVKISYLNIYEHELEQIIKLTFKHENKNFISKKTNEILNDIFNKIIKGGDKEKVLSNTAIKEYITNDERYEKFLNSLKSEIKNRNLHRYTYVHNKEDKEISLTVEDIEITITNNEGISHNTIAKIVELKEELNKNSTIKIRRK